MGEAHSVLPVSTWNFLLSHGSKVIQIFAFQIVHLASTHQSCWQCFHSQHPGPKSVSLWDLPRIRVKSHLSKVSLRKLCSRQIQYCDKWSISHDFIFPINFSEQSHWALSTWLPGLVSWSQLTQLSTYTDLLFSKGKTSGLLILSICYCTQKLKFCSVFSIPNICIFSLLKWLH